MSHKASQTPSPEAQRIGASGPQRGRRGWWQFSLFSLLLLFMIACLISGYVGQSRRMDDARRQIAQQAETIKRLRQELGIDVDAGSALTVDDTSSVHVVALPSFEENAWRWKVFLPPGKQWKFGLEVVESAKIGDTPKLVGSSHRRMQNPGEFLMEARLVRDLNGLAQVRYRIGRDGGSYSAMHLEPQCQENRQVRVQQVGQLKQFVAPSGQRIEVLRRMMTVPQRDSNPSAAAASERQDLVIYLEEDRPRAAGIAPGASSSK